MKLIIYARVSSDASANRRADGLNYGNSEADQLERLTEWCLLNGHEVAATLVDSGISGATVHKRPALKRALAALRDDTADGLVVLQLDRLARSAADWHRMIAHHFLPIPEGGLGKKLICVKEGLDNSTVMGRCMLNMMLALAEMFREVSIERGREMGAYHSRHGRTPSGRVMYGWQTPYGKPFSLANLTVNEAQCDAIKMLLKYRFDWKFSFEKCGQSMTAYLKQHPEAAFRYTRHDEFGKRALTWTAMQAKQVVAQWQRWGMPGDDVVPERNLLTRKRARQIQLAEEEMAAIAADVQRRREAGSADGVSHRS